MESGVWGLGSGSARVTERERFQKEDIYMKPDINCRPYKDQGSLE